MTRICGFPISENKRCRQPINDSRPNCGRHHCEVSADQLGQKPTVYKKGYELHVWAGDPDGPYCLIHSDPAHQALYQVAGEKVPCCLKRGIKWEDKYGEYHRDDGPAIIGVDGSQEWYQHGIWHRDDGPAIIEADGTQKWYQHDELHRDDGPAVIEADGTQEWYRYNELHREDGPAVIWEDGRQEWYWRNKRVTEEEYAELLARKQARGHGKQ